jgi:hypothetical protein
MKKQIYRAIGLGLFIAVTFTPLYAQTTDTPDRPSEPPAAGELGYGVGSVLANIFYMPAKVTYAGLGLLTGGLGYVFSGGRPEVANNIIYPSVTGNYVVTPSHLKGREPLYFVGAPPAETAPAADTPVASVPNTGAIATTP